MDVSAFKKCPKYSKSIYIRSNSKGTYYICKECDYKELITYADIWCGGYE